MIDLDCKEVSDFFKALCHPTRLMIVMELLDDKRCVNDIGELVKLPQPNISQHLAILKANNIVDWLQEGKRKCYFLKSPQLIKNILKLLKEKQNLG